MEPKTDQIHDDDGGDAACWAHLFEGAQGADLGAIAAATAVRGPAWRLSDRDLNATLLVFDTGQGIAPHVNAEVDVLLVGVSGSGRVTIDDVSYALASGQVLLVPRGSERSVTAETDRFAYLSCHRARAPLLPSSRD